MEKADQIMYGNQERILKCVENGICWIVFIVKIYMIMGPILKIFANSVINCVSVINLKLSNNGCFY